MKNKDKIPKGDQADELTPEQDLESRCETVSEIVHKKIMTKKQALKAYNVSSMEFNIYKRKLKVKGGSGLQYGIRGDGDDGSVAEELLMNIPELEQKCKAVDKALTEEYFSFKKALKIYGVTEQQFIDYKNVQVTKEYENLVHLHGEKEVAESFIFPMYYTKKQRKELNKQTSDAIKKMKEGKPIEDKILSLAMELRFKLEDYKLSSFRNPNAELYKELKNQIDIINTIIL